MPSAGAALGRGGGGGGGGDRRLHVCDVDMLHKNLDTLERLSLSDGP